MDRSRYYCKYCNVDPSSVKSLDDHLAGGKHRMVLKLNRPHLVSQINCLQPFLDKYASDQPLLGLEYIEETQWGNFSYKCELCDMRTNRKIIYSHIMGPLHMKKYLDRHHPEQSEKIDRLPETQRKGALRSAAVLIHREHGPKKIKVHVVMTAAKQTKFNFKKLVVRSATERKEYEKKIMLPLRNNDSFMEYLRNFEIQNDEDASFVKEMTENCITALMKFREELVNAEGSQGSLSSSRPASANTEGTDQHGLDTISNSFSSVAKCGQLGAVPERDVVEKRDTTEICSSI